MGLNPRQVRSMTEELKKEVFAHFHKSGATHSVEEIGIYISRGDLDMKMHLEFIQIAVDELVAEGKLRRVVDLSDPRQYEGYQIPYELV